MATNPSELIFVGSEAEGYYGGAYDCFGVFVSLHVFEKYEEVFKEVFSARSHGELDGKQSDVEGDYISVGFNSAEGVARLINEKDIDFDVWHFSEYLEYCDDFDELGEEEINELIGYLDDVNKEVSAMVEEYNSYVFTLTEEEYAEVRTFVDELQKRRQ